MAAFLIANVKVTDDAWVPEYAAKVHDIVHKHGGKYLSRSPSFTQVEGDLPDLNLIALLEFPSVEKAQAFVSDPEYAPFAKMRQDGSESNFYIIDDSDAAGTIPYLPAAG